jgi:hypothetical protein
MIGAGTSQEGIMNIVQWNNPFREMEAMQARLNRMLAEPARFDDPFAFADWAPTVDIQAPLRSSNRRRCVESAGRV